MLEINFNSNAKEGAPSCTRYARKCGKSERSAAKNIVTRLVKRWGGAVLGTALALAIWPAAGYAARGYYAVGGEVFAALVTVWAVQLVWGALLGGADEC